MKRKSGFTLVEMLIVVVIIGILSAALIPRLTGYMAKTRDLKRHADLRDIAAAITMYKNDHGEFPLGIITGWSFCSKVSHLSTYLEPYISSLPKDPNKNNYVNIFTDLHNHRSRLEASGFLPKGDYVYVLGHLRRSESVTYDKISRFEPPHIAVLYAKVETPDAANLVIYRDSPLSWHLGSKIYCRLGHKDNEGFYLTPHRFYNELTECDEIIKGNEASYKSNDDGSVSCTYSSEDQLYYIVKIE